jgi:hypothetical protein
LYTTGEGIHVYGAFWDGSSWLSDPTSVLATVNKAFNNVKNLKFSGIIILSSLSSLGTGMAFTVKDPVYKNKKYISLDEVPILINDIKNALNTSETGIHLTYSDIVVGVSQCSE